MISLAFCRVRAVEMQSWLEFSLIDKQGHHWCSNYLVTADAATLWKINTLRNFPWSLVFFYIRA